MGTAYALTQQSLREAANDPQVQLAHDTSRAMSAGQPNSSDISSTAVDIAHSLAPFVITYDAAGKATAGNGKLNGQLVAPPLGVFEYAKSRSDNRVTWQPDTGVRLAAVIVAVGNAGSGGYVLAGRNLSEVESRLGHLTQLWLLLWLVGLAGSFVLSLIVDRLHQKEVTTSSERSGH